MKLKARALLFALVIGSVVAILSMSMVRMAGLNQFRWAVAEFQSQQWQIEQSAWTYLKAVDATGSFSSWVDIHDNGHDSVFIGSDVWGMIGYSWSVVPGNAHLGLEPIRKSAFWSFPSPILSDHTALYLADQNRPLAMVGEAKIIGTAYLPKSGVRRGNIHGNTYQGQQFVEGSRLESKHQLPDLEVDIQRLFEQLIRLGRTRPIPAFQTQLDQSFSDSVLVLKANEWHLIM
ncbi:MAG: hypothetical protein AAFV80_20570 [Bacteroidota bacterium]